MSTLDATFYLALSESSRWPNLSARLTQKRPALRSGEIAMELNVSVPAALFRRPTLSASISIPDNLPEPSISAEVQDGIAAALSEQLGVQVHLTVQGADE